MGRYAYTLVFVTAGLMGCAATPPPRPIPIPVEVCSLPDKIPERPPWMLERVAVGGMQRVKELGGTNKDLYYVAVRDAEAARTANSKLGMAQDYILLLEKIIRDGRTESE